MEKRIWNREAGAPTASAPAGVGSPRSSGNSDRWGVQRRGGGACALNYGGVGEEGREASGGEGGGGEGDGKEGEQGKGAEWDWKREVAGTESGWAVRGGRGGSDRARMGG